MTKDQLPLIPPKHLKDGCYARADALEAHLEAAKSETARLRETLTYTTLTPNAPAEQFKAVLDAAENGEFVNAQDLINALWWRVRNQRGELRKKNQDIERLRAELAHKEAYYAQFHLEPKGAAHEPSEPLITNPPQQVRRITCVACDTRALIKGTHPFTLKYFHCPCGHTTEFKPNGSGPHRPLLGGLPACL